MFKNKTRTLRQLRSALVCGAATAALALAPAWSQGEDPTKLKAPPTPKDTKASDDNKDKTKDARDTAKDTTKDTRDTAKDTTKDTRDTAKDTTKDARDTAKDTTKDARDTAKDKTPRDPRDTAKDADKTPSDNTKDRDRDARPNTDRDPRRDADRDSRRDDDRDARQHARPERAPDHGLWFSRGAKGLQIADIASKGAISKLGFREGDVLVSVNGQKVSREADFMEYLFADNRPNNRVKVIVLRDGREETINVEPTVFVEEYSYVDNDPLENFGLVLDDRYADRVVVWRVLPQTPAYYSGIRAGDAIVTFNGKKVAALRDFGRLVQDTAPGEIAIEVTRDKHTRKIDAELPRYQARSERTTTFRQDLDRRDDRRDNREERRDDRRDDPKTSEKPTVPPTTVPSPAVPTPNPVNPTTPTTPTPTTPRVPLLPPRR